MRDLERQSVRNAICDYTDRFIREYRAANPVSKIKTSLTETGDAQSPAPPDPDCDIDLSLLITAIVDKLHESRVSVLLRPNNMYVLDHTPHGNTAQDPVTACLYVKNHTLLCHVMDALLTYCDNKERYQVACLRDLHKTMHMNTSYDHDTYKVNLADWALVIERLMLGLHRTREYINCVQNEDTDDLVLFRNMVKALVLYSELGISPYDSTGTYPPPRHDIDEIGIWCFMLVDGDEYMVDMPFYPGCTEKLSFFKMIDERMIFYDTALHDGYLRDMGRAAFIRTSEPDYTIRGIIREAALAAIAFVGPDAGHTLIGQIDESFMLKIITHVFDQYDYINVEHDTGHILKAQCLDRIFPAPCLNSDSLAQAAVALFKTFHSGADRRHLFGKMHIIPAFFENLIEFREALDRQTHISRKAIEEIMNDHDNNDRENNDDDASFPHFEVMDNDDLLKDFFSDESEEVPAPFASFGMATRAKAEPEAPPAPTPADATCVTIFPTPVPQDIIKKHAGRKGTNNRIGLFAELNQPLPLAEPTTLDMAPLVARFPHAAHAINEMARVFNSRQRFGKFIRPRPIMLAGPSGCGKTSLARAFFEHIGLPFDTKNVASIHDTFYLTGNHKGFSESGPSQVIERIAMTRCPNMAFILDEVDKVSNNLQHGCLQDALLAVADKKEAEHFRDYWLDLDADLSWLSWVFTVNDLDRVSPALRSRCTIIPLEAPKPKHMPAIAANLMREIEAERGLCPGWYHLSTFELRALGEVFRGDLRTFKRYVEAVADEQEDNMARA
ncbi:AAA family ATPase [Komagataeibacter xylinus]|uniref:AAA family ATPase n=1 Tax=Komagataeibacter xylinus TaxID=28448 RepID=UPI00280C1A85|nr:AAA family ATPase [Komagataeibacter xylinus]